jgi:hypothetical protein
METFSARIGIIGINPCVIVPDDVLSALLAKAGKSKGPVPVRGTLNAKPFLQNVVKYQGAWRLYLNGPMRKAAGIDVGDMAHIALAFDPALRMPSVPPLFAEALKREKKAKAAFDALAPSRRKEILRYLGFLKSEKTLAVNIEIVLAHLLGKKTAVRRAFLRD